VILTDTERGVTTLTLNRPKALNALDRDLTVALREAVYAAEQSAAVRCLVIRGGEHFMAGGDLRWFHREIQGKTPAEKRAMFEGFIGEVHGIIISLRRMPKPADSAYFTLAYSLIGASPDGGSTFALPRVVGAKKAMEIALLGERLDAAAAERLGLVNRAALETQLQREAEAFAQCAAEPNFAEGLAAFLEKRKARFE
jgi:2-(1,2-epoxy-1,2-dihydrophenyl)acetyl-CoA isomerase